MILPFSTQLNGKPTLFIEKIWEGFFRNDFFDGKDTEFIKYFDLHREKFGKVWDELPADTRLEAPKIHTIRKDEKDRWKPGKMIDFFINNRSKNAFRFAPRIPVVLTQDIFMSRRGSMLEISIAKPRSYIGGEDFMLNAGQQELLAKNDGFDNYDDFRNYFISVIEENGKVTGHHWFSGKIIHWTNFKYE